MKRPTKKRETAHLKTVVNSRIDFAHFFGIAATNPTLTLGELYQIILSGKNPHAKRTQTKEHIKDKKENENI